MLKLTGKRTVIAAALLAGVVLLYVQGNEERQQGNTSSETATCRVAAKEDGVRIRNAPVPEDPANVVDELAAGEEADATTEIQNGFRKLSEGRWVSVEFTQPLEGRKC
ncbi:SH3 domain-containing protein [Actinophytocola sp.]|uniref:SH3 domain-containing protein n=1 Tax=Actinophytocola sp. TaxID=1872138 RepID=UPI002ED13DAA